MRVTTSDRFLVIEIEVVVKKGDKSATALFNNKTNKEKMTKSFSTKVDSQAALGQSMEWIVERLHDKVLNPTGKLLNFGSILITDCSGSTAKKSGSIDPSKGVAIDMKNVDDGDVNAATSTVDGTTISVIWHTV